jgi:uncharacterized membrane protein YdjX (TVP38/TMEM64 family)
METNEGEQEQSTVTSTLDTVQGNAHDLESNSPQIEEEEKEDIDDSATARLCSDALKRIVVGIFLLGVISFLIADAATTGYVRSAYESFLAWIENNPAAGVFAFMGVYFAATVLFLPVSILTLGSGFVFANAFGLGFGSALAIVAVFFGASTGAIAAFLIGRYLLHNWVQKLTEKYPSFEAIDRALEEKGFRIMVLLHLSPIVPFNALNYIGGFTSMSLVDYTLSLFAILPGTVFYVFLGATAGSLAGGSTNTTQIVTIVVGVTFGFLGIGFTTYYATQEFRKLTEAREALDITIAAVDEDGSHEPTDCSVEAENTEGGENGCMFCQHPQFLG